MTTYYEVNKDKCIKRATNRYNKIKDDEDFILYTHIYNKMYYENVIKPKKSKRFQKLEKLKNRTLEFPNIDMKINDPFTITFD